MEIRCAICGDRRFAPGHWAGMHDVDPVSGQPVPGGTGPCGDVHRWIDRIWILGAPDPEMKLIERILRRCDEKVIYATDENGQRVHPGSAYRCPVPTVPENVTVYAVECIDELPEGWIRIDHHRPGDPGYGRPPEEFLSASSIGQVIARLVQLGDGASIPYEILLAAAADHCLAAAYRGECPGVDPDTLMRWRVQTRAAFQRRPVEDILADVERARVALREAPTTDIGGRAIRDLRDRRIPELPDAAMREGVAYLATVTDRDGRTRIIIGGHTTPETVRAFLSEWAPAQGLTDVYGDPARGFAGGYLPHDKETMTV